MAHSSEDIAQLVTQHLFDIASGRCTITREQILAGQEDQSLSEILTGLLMLHEDLQLRNSQVVRAEELAAALAKLADRNRELEQSRAELAALNAQLSTPIIKIWNGVLMIPLLGAFDAVRASDMTERLLTAIQVERASYLILDITGVAEIDAPTANHFLRIVQATRLLGAETLITGLRPAVATALVALGVDLSSLNTLRTAEAALRHCQSRTSGMSSPCSTMYCLCAISRSRKACFWCAATRCNPGTRSITSIARWKRSKSFSTVMSNGVVVVPSSL